MKKANRTIRFPSFSTIIPSLIRIVAVCAALLSVAVHGNTLSWSGGGFANAYWNNINNWGGAGIPGNGDTIIFQGPQPNLLNTNNIVGLTLNQIRFIGGSGGFDLRGNAFTLTNSIIATNTAGANIIENNITLATATNVQMVVSTGVSLTLDGNLSGSVGVNKAGLGTLTYQGPSDNTYTGTTLVSSGTLQLNVGGYNAFGGPLIIGDGSGAAATVRDLQFEEISESVPITINYDGVLDLNNYNETIGPNLTLSGGTIQTGTATLTLSANSTITTTNGYASYIYGYLNIGSGTLTLQGNGFLFLYASVNGSANIVQSSQNGYLDAFWSGTNTYTGNYTANNTVVYLINSLALGNTNNAMTLNGYTYLEIAGNVNITNQSLTINDSGELEVYGPSTNSWRANFTLGSACTMNVETNSALNLNGPIGGSGGVTKIGRGPVGVCRHQQQHLCRPDHSEPRRIGPSQKRRRRRSCHPRFWPGPDYWRRGGRRRGAQLWQLPDLGIRAGDHYQFRPLAPEQLHGWCISVDAERRTNHNRLRPLCDDQHGERGRNFNGVRQCPPR